MVRSKMTREQFAEAAKVLQEKEGITLAGDQGDIENRGVKATYLYAGDCLQITVTKTPFILSKKFCEGEIAAGLREHGFTAEVVG